MVYKLYILENKTKTVKLTNSKTLFKLFFQNIRGLNERHTIFSVHSVV